MRRVIKKSVLVALLLTVSVALSACGVTTRQDRYNNILLGAGVGAGIGVAVGGAAGAMAGAATGTILGALYE